MYGGELGDEWAGLRRHLHDRGGHQTNRRRLWDSDNQFLRKSGLLIVDRHLRDCRASGLVTDLSPTNLFRRL
ncbi:hypothetical protein Dimus_010610, partial [Dionaea muscipula]